MEHFDLYFVWPRDKAGISSPVVGLRYFLDGYDGFFDQYFDGCPLQIRFVVLIGDLIPIEQESFENLVFIEAKVVDRGQGKIEVIRITSLGEWMRTTALSEDNVAPFHSEHERELFSTLLKEANYKSWVLSKASRNPENRLGQLRAC